jgi:hypothetical protein
MAILDMQLVQVGVVGFPVQQLLINTDNTIEEVVAPGYLTQYGNNFGIGFSERQTADVYTTDGKVGTYQVTVDSDGIASLSADTDGIVNLPVVSGDFAVFDGTTGVIKDAGYSASNAAKTKVVMAAGATIVNYIAKYADTAGTIGPVGQAESAAYNLGDIHAGVSGVFGRLFAHAPVAEKGSLVLQGGNNASDYTVSIINRSHAQVSTRNIPDVGANADFLLTTLASPDANINLVRFDASVTTAALNSGAVTLFTGSGAKQYKIVALWLNFGSNLTTGDKDLAISDGTTTYSVIPSASLLTLVNATWGSTALPFPTAAALTTSTAAGASLSATYSGGTTNYDAGATIVISGILQRVA